MEIFTEREITEKVVTDIVCDKCNKLFNYETDILEFQEILSIDFYGGYGSVFGDGVNVKCGLCQYCLKELLGEYFRYE